ncbi:SsrA-binding protein SmpB [Patescibacteria group bacterium]|nr:SsrA-binding protein SmpB [Patescibacteria group bacterium]
MPTLAENRKAHHDYQILETLEAGLVLKGQEVKAIRQGKLQLAGSFVSFRGGELYLLGSTLPPYQPKNAGSDYDPDRARKLLMKKEELRSLYGRSKQEGLTFVPLRVYTSKAKLKLAFGIARGKRKGDKRELLKKREAQREMERALKRR